MLVIHFMTKLYCHTDKFVKNYRYSYNSISENMSTQVLQTH